RLRSLPPARNEANRYLHLHRHAHSEQTRGGCMTCHLTFTKLSERPAPRGASSMPAVPSATTQHGAKILHLPKRAHSTSALPTGAASVASPLFPPPQPRFHRSKL